MIMVFKREHSLFLNTLFCIGIFQACSHVHAIPVNLVPTPSEGIKYPINIACECDYSLYVDGKFIDQANKEVNIVENIEYGHPGWNATKTFYPIIYDESPKIIALYGTGSQFPGLLNGFVMDMNDSKDYTKHQEWKCKDFSSTANKVPPGDWFMFDYDDKDWAMSTSFGKNYQNNSFQIFETERVGINLQAEWLWTSENSNSNIYCRKKNGNVRTIPLEVTTTPAQTSAPTRVSVPVSTKIHTTVAQTSAPTRVSATAPANYNLVYSPHIKIIIQNVRYSRNRSYNHIDNLLRRLKIYHDDDNIYQQILHTRHHIQHHYNTILHDIRILIHSLHSRHASKPTLHFIQSMRNLDTSIKKIEHSLHFIKGNHKYILLHILNKLKLQYQQATEKLLTLIKYT